MTLALGRTFKTLAPVGATSPHLVDPRANQCVWQTHVAAASFVLGPRQCALAESAGEVEIPPGFLGLVLPSHPHAPCLLAVRAAPLPGGFKGRVALGLTNLSDRYLKLYAGDGIARVALIREASRCETPMTPECQSQRRVES